MNNFMKHFYNSIFKVSLLLLCLLQFSISFGRDYEAPRAQVAPVIDGLGNDACWNTAPWYSIDQVWLLATPTAADFTGRFKIVWDANKVYVLGEITDDVFNDYHADPLSNYWEDDCFEVFFDEDNSGGGHEFSYNAFAYHISRFYDVADIGPDRQPHLYNDHVTVQRTSVGNVHTWECAFTVYTDAFELGATNNPVANLTLGKQIGFALAYCDNDGGSTRQSFIGSEVIEGSNKNVAYQNANVFGNLTLVETASPPAHTFTHVMVANGLSAPTVMVCAPDGRIFICEQAGKVKIIKNGTLLSTPAVTVAADISGGDYSERGLIGLALHPDFATNNYIYLYYTTTEGGTHNRVSRFTMNGDVVVPGSEVVILELDPLSTASNHNGGAMQFGPDGKLYIATGENATPANSQNLENYHGKLLRVNEDGSVPSDNPYAASASVKTQRIWSHGLRNPFTFDIQLGTGKIFVNDVGQEAWEEINDATEGGKNFGWPTSEGKTTNPAFTSPVYAYGRPNTDSTGCAITGGTFFNPSETGYPSMYKGKYFFMDYCNNWINYIDPDNNYRRKTFSKNVASAPVAIDVASDGNLYYLSRGTSSVYKIMFTGTLEPTILDHPRNITVFESQPATLSVVVAGSQPMSYQWMKNGVNITGATSANYTIPAVVPGDAGDYSVTITNLGGSVTSNAGTLTVGPLNSKPVATIIAPVHGGLYRGNDVISFSGSATDPEDGTLPASAFTWFVNFHHDTHVHDGTPLTGVKNGSFTIPVTGETSANVWFRIILIVTDAMGLKDSAMVEIFPRKSNLSFETIPPGLQIKLDGQPKATPLTVESVHNVIRSASPVSPQYHNGNPYVFEGWVNGGDVEQTFATPTTNKTFTAKYRPLSNDTTRFPVIHDAFVQYEDYDPVGVSADKTFGTTDPEILVTKTLTGGNNRLTYLKFNIAGYTDSIHTAMLRLYGFVEQTTTDPVSAIPVTVLTSSNTTWNENTITWTNKPVASAAGLDTIIVSGHSGGYFYWDITSYLRKERAAGRTTVTLVLKNTAETFPRIYFNSKENVSGKHPELILTKPAVPLSAVIFNFQGESDSGNVTLTWNTSYEQDNDYFEVLRSLDASTYSLAGTVNGAGNSTDINSYDYFDQYLGPATYYYKLKQVSSNGAITFSKIIAIKVDPVLSIRDKIKPVYTKGEIIFHFKGKASMSIFDLYGREVKKIKLETAPITVERGALPMGVYTYWILPEDSNEQYSGKIIFIE